MWLSALSTYQKNCRPFSLFDASLSVETMRVRPCLFIWNGRLLAKSWIKPTSSAFLSLPTSIAQHYRMASSSRNQIEREYRTSPWPVKSDELQDFGGTTDIWTVKRTSTWALSKANLESLVCS